MHIMTAQSSFKVCQIGTLVTLTDDWYKADTCTVEEYLIPAEKGPSNQLQQLVGVVADA
jgi:hypothetical protein